MEDFSATIFMTPQVWRSLGSFSSTEMMGFHQESPEFHQKTWAVNGALEHGRIMNFHSLGNLTDPN